MERALRAGLEQGMHWLIHCDPDELLHPQSASFDIAAGVPALTISTTHRRFHTYDDAHGECSLLLVQCWRASLAMSRRCGSSTTRASQRLWIS